MNVDRRAKGVKLRALKGLHIWSETMSDTLWAAVIGGASGGIIAIVATIPPLIVNHYRWKKEKKLEHLRTERRHLEGQYIQILSKLAGVAEGHANWDTLAQMCIALPEDIYIQLWSLLQTAKSDHSDKLDICSKITGSMRKSLAEINKEIKELMS